MDAESQVAALSPCLALAKLPQQFGPIASKDCCSGKDANLEQEMSWLVTSPQFNLPEIGPREEWRSLTLATEHGNWGPESAESSPMSIIPDVASGKKSPSSRHMLLLSRQRIPAPPFAQHSLLKLYISRMGRPARKSQVTSFQVSSGKNSCFA